MTDQNSAAEERPTLESLFPERYGKPAETEPEGALETETEESVADESLAEVQEDEDEQTEEPEAESSEGTIGKMPLKDFLGAAGVTHEEFYRDVYVERDGEQVSISKAWDDYKSVKEANDSLLRERAELKKQVDTQATQVPAGNTSPEAQAFIAQAQVYQQVLEKTDWSQMDAGQAASQKFDIQNAVNQLVGQAQQAQMKWQGEMQEKWKKAQEESDRQTRSRIPEWNDGTVRGTETTAMKDWAAGYGFSSAEFESIHDPRVMHILRDAWKATQTRKRIEQGAKKIRRVPKTTLGSGARETAPASKSAKQHLENAREAIGKATTDAERRRIRLTTPLG